LIEENLVALSASDIKPAVAGESILLRDGLAIEVYSDDLNDDAQPDNLVASGVVERNSTGGSFKQVKWCCRIDNRGIRNESDLA
jgi:hypothetical protein